jgi:hypothetical protein
LVRRSTPPSAPTFCPRGRLKVNVDLAADLQLAAVWAQLSAFGQNIAGVPLFELRDRLTDFETRIAGIVVGRRSPARHHQQRRVRLASRRRHPASRNRRPVRPRPPNGSYQVSRWQAWCLVAAGG